MTHIFGDTSTIISKFNALTKVKLVGAEGNELLVGTPKLNDLVEENNIKLGITNTHLALVTDEEVKQEDTYNGN